MILFSDNQGSKPKVFKENKGN